MNYEGKYESEYVHINGIEEFFLHFPSSPEKEVILFLHGGPGTSEAVTGHNMLKYHEDKFHVVYFDQRGTGKTFVRNVEKEADINNLLEDLEESVEYIKNKYKKEKIIILGHSWGTVLGTLYVKKHPENVLCYVGVAQVININDNERSRCNYLIDMYSKSGKRRQEKFLQRLGEKTDWKYNKSDLSKNQILRLRMMQMRNKMLDGASLSMLKIMKNSPVYEKTDLKVMMSAKKRCTKLWEYIYNYNLYEIVNDWPVRALFISGSKDFQVPNALVKEYFDTISGEESQLEIFEGAGHFVMFDEGEKFWDTIYKFVMKS
jgi:pimeloyl-ACP methyl ester carboxylesterase